MVTAVLEIGRGDWQLGTLASEIGGRAGAIDTVPCRAAGNRDDRSLSRPCGSVDLLFRHELSEFRGLAKLCENTILHQAIAVVETFVERLAQVLDRTLPQP